MKFKNKLINLGEGEPKELKIGQNHEEEQTTTETS